MASRLTINAITNSTEDWSCKIQVVDKTLPRESINNKKYQLLILQDEEESQVQALIFEEDIIHFKEVLHPFCTYLIRVARVKESTYAFGTPLNKYTWTIDKNTIVEPIDKVTPSEVTLPPPTRLTVTPFDEFEYQDSEFDVIGIVLNASPETVASNGGRIQDFILIDEQKRPVKITFWEDFIDHYGSKIVENLDEFPVILARGVAKSMGTATNKFYGLKTKFFTFIHVDPPYGRAAELKIWAQKNEKKLKEYAKKIISKDGIVQLIAFEDESVFASNIDAQPLGQVFKLEAELSLSNENQRFCFLACSKCKQFFTRIYQKNVYYCAMCKQSNEFIPRCQFEVEVKDKSGSATVLISGEVAQKMLDLSIEEIYDICCVKKHSLPLRKAQDRLAGKVFTIEMHRKLGKNQDAGCPRTFIYSYTEKEIAPGLQLQSPVTNALEGTKRKLSAASTGVPKMDHDPSKKH